VQGFVAVFSASSLVVGSSPAFADVSDGNALPQGAAQFSRILRAKSDLAVRVCLLIRTVGGHFLDLTLLLFLLY
jgi:hypothetical protein